MSEHEAAARYEHATTLLDWHHAIDAPPPVKPPTGDDGWMLFSQTPTPSTSGDVTRFLCVWRRRLVAPKGKPVTDGREPGDDVHASLVYKARARLPAVEAEARAEARAVWDLVRNVPGVRCVVWLPPSLDTHKAPAGLSSVRPGSLLSVTSSSCIFPAEIAVVTFGKHDLSAMGQTMTTVAKEVARVVGFSNKSLLPRVKVARVDPRIRSKSWETVAEHDYPPPLDDDEEYVIPEGLRG